MTPQVQKSVYNIDTLFLLRDTSTGQVAAAYESALARQGRASATARKYLPVVRSFLDWGAASLNRPPTSLDIDVFLAQREAEIELRVGRRPCRATVRAQIAALRSFFSYLERSGLLTDTDGRPVTNPMTAIVAPTLEQRPNDFLRPAEDVALLECGSPPPERVVVWLLRWTGLRVAEACALRFEDLDLTAGQESLVVRKSKTNAGLRTIPLVPNLVPELEAWQLRTGAIDTPRAYVLSTSTGAPYKPTFVWRLVKRAGARAGVRTVTCECGSKRRSRHERGCPRTVSGENVSAITPHTLRRTFGSYLLNRGLRLEVVSRLLGHSSTVITERAYAELLSPTIRDELLAVFADDR